MSFGYSIGDFVAIGQLTWTAYKSCKAAPGEFQEITRELSSLHTILHELEDEAKTPTSLLNRRGGERKPELEALLANLSTTLNQVDDIVKRYHSLGRDQKKTWDRVNFATKDLADLRIEGLLDELVRDIKEGRKEPTIVSTYEDNDELAWDELERELVGDGITREDVRDHREEIRDYLRKLVEENIDDIGPSGSFSLATDPDNSHYSANREPAILERSSSSTDEVLNTFVPAFVSAKIFYTPFHELTLAERQTLVFAATKSPNQLRTLRIPNPSDKERDRAKAVAKKIAFDQEAFDYHAYEKLGNATDDIKSLPLKNFFRLLNLSSNANVEYIAAHIICVLKELQLKYIEIPSGFRCLWKDKFTEFLVIIVKLPLFKTGGITFQNIFRGPLEDSALGRTIKKNISGIMVTTPNHQIIPEHRSRLKAKE